MCKINRDIEIGYLNKGEGTFEDRHALDIVHEEYIFFKINGHVRVLDLKNLKLGEIPKSIGNLIRLKELRLRENKLVSLPKEIENIQRLKYLDIYKNSFKSIPKSMVKMRKLENLWLDGNQIESIPHYALEFIRNKIATKYIETGMDKFNAEILGIMEIFYGSPSLRFNDTETPFSEDLYHKGFFFYYDMNDAGYINQFAISEICLDLLIHYICKLEHLEKLYLYDCKIKKISIAVKRLKRLKLLVLYKNNIKKVPKSIIALESLIELDLRKNQIKRIPKFIENMKEKGINVHL